jgi:AFG3 family protein
MDTGSVVDSSSAINGGTGTGVWKFYFNIGSIESFERKMEEAEEDLGHDPDSYVPITYSNELSWQQELLRLAPTLLLIGGYVWFTRRQMGGLSGTGGMGGRGIFNVGKAQVRFCGGALLQLCAL